MQLFLGNAGSLDLHTAVLDRINTLAIKLGGALQ
jgi:hypothetical protein